MPSRLRLEGNVRIMNKQSRTADKGVVLQLGVRRRADNSFFVKRTSMLRNVSRGHVPVVVNAVMVLKVP